MRSVANQSAKGFKANAGVATGNEDGTSRQLQAGQNILRSRSAAERSWVTHVYERILKIG